MDKINSFENCQQLTEGGDHWSFLVDDKRIVKIPKSKAALDRTLKEKYFLEQHSPVLRSILPRLLSYTNEYCPVFVYEKIEGQRAILAELTIAQKKSVAKDLGHFMSSWHQLEVGHELKAHLKQTSIDISLFRKDSEHYLQSVLSVLPKQDHAIVKKWYDVDWENQFVRTPTEMRFCHLDLKGEHIFLNQDLTKVVGIIDWGDAAIAEIYRDFAGCIIWQGLDFLEMVLESYPNKNMDLNQAFASAQKYAEHHCLINLGKTLRQEWKAPKGLIVKQFERSTKLSLQPF